MKNTTYTLRVLDRTETTAYITDGTNEAKYCLDADSGAWYHDNDTAGDLEVAMEQAFGSLDAAHVEIGRILGE